jgi:hypothetical protein
MAGKKIPASAGIFYQFNKKLTSEVQAHPYHVLTGSD